MCGRMGEGCCKVEEEDDWVEEVCGGVEEVHM